MKNSVLYKLFLVIKVIKNLNIFFLDYFGVLSNRLLVYKTWSGLSIWARAGTSDKGEMAIIMGDSEYPKKFFPSGRDVVMVDIGAHIGLFSLYFNSLKYEVAQKPSSLKS